MSCIGRDPLCPCQDGDPCHYRDYGKLKAWPLPIWVQGMIYLEQLSNRDLCAVARNPRSKAFQRARQALDSLLTGEGRRTNPSWISSQAALTAHDRNIMGQDEYQRIYGA